MIEYTHDIVSVPPETILIDVHYGKKEDLQIKHESSQYMYLHFKKIKIYMDLAKANNKITTLKHDWDSLKITHFIIHVSTSLLEETELLEHILASLVRSISNNIYKTNTNITITHNGKYNKHLYSIIQLINNVQMARKLSMTPANKATPLYMAHALQKLFADKAKCKILKSSYLDRHGFGLIQAVGQGATNKHCMLVVERFASSKYPTVCIVGKGITFDSGGLSLKPYQHIIHMKFDKIGAINGSMALLNLMKLKHVNIIGLFPFAENAVSGTSIHPGDVVKSFLGKTVEIVDPDAEGRLIMADAFAYAHKYKPDLIIDIATLTGHSDRINCWHYGYYFASKESLKTDFEKLTNNIGERMIPMPTWDDYGEVLNSPVADLVNSPSTGCSDSFVAALFLKEFIPKDTDWLHIDLAHEYTNASIPNGNGIRSIVHLVEEYVAKKK